MQRRAAALYFALFLVIGAGSFGYIQMVDAQKPTVELESDEYSQGDVLTVDGRTYVVSEIAAENASEGEEAAVTGTLSWTNQSARATATLENATNATYQNASWEVRIDNASDVSQFTLRENVNDSQQDPQTVTFSEGEQFDYTTEDGATQAARIDDVTGNVSTPSVTLSWEEPKENQIELTEGANVTLNGQQRVVHFPSSDSVQLSTDIATYQDAQDKLAYFDERKKGLWGVSIISFLAAIVLLGTAYLPVKD